MSFKFSKFNIRTYLCNESNEIEIIIIILTAKIVKKFPLLTQIVWITCWSRCITSHLSKQIIIMALMLNYTRITLYTLCTAHCALRTQYFEKIRNKFHGPFKIAIDFDSLDKHYSYFFLSFLFDLSWEKTEFVVTITPKCRSSCKGKIVNFCVGLWPIFVIYFVVATIRTIRIVTFDCQESRILNYWKHKIMMMMFWARSMGHQQWVTLWFVIFQIKIHSKTSELELDDVVMW